MVTAFQQRLAGLRKPTGERKPFSQRVLERMLVKPDWSGKRITSTRRSDLEALGRELRDWMRTPTDRELREHYFSFEYLPQLVDNASELQVIVNEIKPADLPSEWYVDLLFQQEPGTMALAELYQTLHFTEIEAEQQLDDSGEMFATTLLEAWVLRDAITDMTFRTYPRFGGFTGVVNERAKFTLLRKAVLRFGVPLPEVAR